jgi:hypothetical protein
MRKAVLLDGHSRVSSEAVTKRNTQSPNQGHLVSSRVLAPMLRTGPNPKNRNPMAWPGLTGGLSSAHWHFKMQKTSVSRQLPYSSKSALSRQRRC